MTVQFVSDGRERRHPWRLLVRASRRVDRRFFPLFAAHAALATDALRALTALLQNVAAPDGGVREIEALERRADGGMEEGRGARARSFFPPFGRTVVYELANRIDDVLDVAEDAAQSLHLYHVTQLTPEAVRLAELAVESSVKLQSAIAQLEKMAAPQAILRLCAEVDQLEAQADHVMRAAMSRLFREEPDAHQLVKLKAVYELLETLTDRCKVVSNDIEALVLRHG